MASCEDNTSSTPSLASTSVPSSDGGIGRNNLPPLIDTFPSEIHPVREIGAGFTAQSVHGAEADACAETAAEMMVEARSMAVSNVSSESGSVQVMEGEHFMVPELPRPADAVQDGLLIVRNERLFPGMVAISLPLHGILWVREDGTFNLSGFFRRQIPKFETAALVAASADVKEHLDVYHVFYSPALESAVARRQFKVMRKVIEAGMRYYTEPDCPARKELMDLRRRVGELRTQTASADGNGTNGAAASGGTSVRQSSWIAQQVVTGAPKQKSPFRLWKTETGKEGYDKSKPS
eukprot:jgi/Undpi1/8396/HiC_scaffold_25.g10864.m1